MGAPLILLIQDTSIFIENFTIIKRSRPNIIWDFKHPYFRDNFFGSQAIWLGSHPEASGHGSSKRRASRGISGFSSLGKIHG